MKHFCKMRTSLLLFALSCTMNVFGQTPEKRRPLTTRVYMMPGSNIRRTAGEIHRRDSVPLHISLNPDVGTPDKVPDKIVKRQAVQPHDRHDADDEQDIFTNIGQKIFRRMAVILSH